MIKQFGKYSIVLFAIATQLGVHAQNMNLNQPRAEMSVESDYNTISSNNNTKPVRIGGSTGMAEESPSVKPNVSPNGNTLTTNAGRPSATPSTGTPVIKAKPYVYPNKIEWAPQTYTFTANSMYGYTPPKDTNVMPPVVAQPQITEVSPGELPQKATKKK